MKKSLLALATTLLLPNMSYAAACADGANPVGCSVTTSDITYTLTGNISPASGVVGIFFSGANRNNVTQTGNISTTGSSAYGLYLRLSDNNTTNLTGNITTAGDFADGLDLDNSDSNIINLTGNISTAGRSAYGLSSDSSAGNSINLTGNISTTGYSADGLIFWQSDNNTTNLTNITTAGDYADGLILWQSDNNTTNLTGNITTAGDYAFGLYLWQSASNTTTLTGNISTTGVYAHGLSLDNSDNTTTTLTGNISTTGAGARGLSLNDSDSNSINLTGSLSATGTGAYAIYADSTSDNNTITFNQGTKIIGGLYNDGANNTLKFNLGRAASYNFTTSGAVNWVLDDTTKTVIAGSAKSRGVADMDDAGNRLYQRFNPISRATSAQHKNVARGDSRHDVWVDGYYSDSDRTTSLKELNQKTRGLTVGFNVSGDRQLPLDFIINFENTDTGYGLSDQSIDSNSMMVGLSYPQLMQAFNGSLALQFLTGVADNDSAIKVLNNTVSSGQETVNADYTSYYAMLGAEWLQPLYQGENIQHDLYLGLDVMHEKINSHSSSSYFYMSDRDITQLNSSMHYGIAFNSSDKKLRIQAKAGIEQTDMLEGEYQYYKVDGTATRFKGDERNTYMTASLGAAYKFTDNAKAYFNVQKFDSSDDIDGTSGNVGLVVSF